MPASTERELKLDVPNKFSLVRLAEHLGPYRLSAPELHRLHTTYYDTDDLRLARWGASLRYRQGEAWTLKLPEPPKNGAVYRTEHTFTGEPSRIPDAVLDLAAALLRGRQPGPLADGRLEPALPAIQLHENATIFDLVRVTLSASVDHLVRADPMLRVSPSADAVHDARVAVRKLRSHLRTFAPVTDRAWAGGLGEQLRWFGDVLGAARDADVLVAGLAEHVEQLPSTDRHHSEQVLAPFRARRDAAYQDLGRALRDPAYAALLDAAIAAASAPHVCRPQRSAASVVPRLMQRVWKKLRKRVRRAGPEPTDRDLHRIRIQAKHTRYAAEALTPIIGNRARRFGHRAEEVQGLLGKQHDAVAAGIALRAHILEGEHAFIGGEFAAIQRADAQHYRERFPRCWQRLARPKHRRFWA
jgi:CHAD domain-containing protein